MDKVRIINGGIFTDDRGVLRFVNAFDFSDVKRFYQVENHNKGFIRAWHGHIKEAKYVYVVKGAALIGAVSFTSNEVISNVISSENPKILYIPPKHYNGFMTLTDDTIVQFFSTLSVNDSVDDDIRKPWDTWDIWNINHR